MGVLLRLIHVAGDGFSKNIITEQLVSVQVHVGGIRCAIINGCLLGYLMCRCKQR